MAIGIVQPGEGTLWELGSRITCKVSSVSTQDEYSVLEVLLEIGQGSPLHVHRRESEIVYVAEGECTIGNGEQSYPLPAGCVVVFERETPHFFLNESKAITKLIITAVPGGLDRYFDEVNAALQQDNEGEIENINLKYAIEFLEA